MTRRLSAVALLLMAGWSPGPVGGAHAAARCTAAHFRVRELPLTPTAINDRGTVAGTTEDHRAALWNERSGLEALPLPPGFSRSSAVALNERGHAVVVAQDETSTRRQSFVFADGKLKPLSGDQTRALHLNAMDEVVGEAVMPGLPTTQPVVWERGVARSLGGCCGGSAVRINSQGEAIGEVYDSQGRYAAFLWTRSQGLVPIGPPNRYSSAIALNRQGHVVIEGFPGVFLYAQGALTPLTLAPRLPSHPRAINDCDVIVGAYGPFSDAYRAFIWDAATGFRDLNALIVADAGWKLEAALDINNQGAIVGKGDFKHRDDSGFLLTAE